MIDPDMLKAVAQMVGATAKLITAVRQHRRRSPLRGKPPH